MRLRAGAFDMVMNGTEINEINVGQAVGSLHNLRSMMFDIIMNIIQSIIYIIPDLTSLTGVCVYLTGSKSDQANQESVTLHCYS